MCYYKVGGYMNINLILNKTRNGKLLTQEEVEYFLNFYSEKIKEEYNLDGTDRANYKVCYSTSLDVSTEMILRSGLNGSLLNINKELQIPLVHYSNVIVFYTEEEISVYLIDLTYNQFFRKYNNDSDIYCDEVISDANRQYVVDSLNNKGYFKLDNELLKAYIDIFKETYPDNTISNEDAYRNVIERINKEAFINVLTIEPKKIKKM